MEAEFLAPTLDNHRTALHFVLEYAGRRVNATITIEALEQHFWLSAGANAAQVLKVFDDGRRRILAVAARKWLSAAVGKSVALTARDFKAPT